MKAQEGRLAGTVGRGGFLVVCVACCRISEVYRMHQNCIYGCELYHILVLVVEN